MQTITTTSDAEVRQVGGEQMTIDYARFTVSNEPLLQLL